MKVQLYVMEIYQGEREIGDDSICGRLLRGHFREAMIGVKQANVEIGKCQSTNHHKHRGELWQCENCKRWVCENEGTDDHPELCDSCWAEKFYKPKM